MGHGGWVSIYPFLTIDICPTCGAREVFFIESWERAKKRVTLKSFERGHTERSQEIDRTLKQIRA